MILFYESWIVLEFESFFDEKETVRLEAFSDGVFAIAITLLVLDLVVPKGLNQGALWNALFNQWPSYLAFLISFLTIGVMWVNHHRLFSIIHKSDNRLLLLNTILLFTVTVVPFPTKLAAEYLGHDGEFLAVLIYAIWGFVIAIAFTLLWQYASDPKKRFLKLPADSKEVAAIHNQYKFGPLWYLIAIGAAFWQPVVALAICGLLAIFFARSPRMS